MLDRLVSNDIGFGPRSYLALFIWVIALAVGFYLYNMWQERNAVRMRFMRGLGLGLLIAGGVGVVLMLLRGINIPVVSWPLWGYLAMLGTLAFLAWAGWFYANKLPALVAAAGRQGGRMGAPANRQGARSGGGARTYGSGGSGGARTYSAPSGDSNGSTPSTPRPVATTTRREARRDRKRKSR
jgi:hypothetical protein